MGGILNARRGALVLGSFLLLAAVAAGTARAQPILPDGDFEATTAGWATSNGALAMAARADAPSGTSVASLTASAQGTVVLRSQYWLMDATPGATYQATAWLLDDDPQLRGPRMRLDFLSAAGAVLQAGEETGAAPDVAAFQRVSSAESVAPAGARYVSVVILADALSAGASFFVDAVAVDQAAPAPASTPTVQPPPTGAPAPTPTPSATARPTSTPRLTATPTPTPAPSSTPAPLPSTLRNAGFEDGTDAWEVTNGTVTGGGAVIGPSFGVSLILATDGSNSAWVQQLCAVTPGRWYDASAILAPLENVGAAWVRIAWYASATGNGAQLSTEDSPFVISPAGGARSATYATVATGAVQAPPEARAARVRIVLQPRDGSPASLAIDDVALVEASPPPAVTATPAPSATDPPSPTATSGPASGGGASSAPAPVVTAAPTATDAAQRFFRITELMPDPIEDGRDNQYEWVEITNLGPGVASLAGMRLRDNAATTALPAVEVAPGASVVVAGARASVDADVRIDGSIGNGLGNAGDTLELLDAAGVVVDALAYGDATPPAEVTAVTAPGPGLSLARWFDAGGRLLGAATGAPTPGIHASAAAAGSSGTASATPETPTTGTGGDGSPGSTDSADSAWVLLLAIAGGALGGATVQRLGASRRRR